MADNYLETRYSEVFENNNSKTKQGLARPFLDSLLRRSASSQAEPSRYKIHRLQAEAILRSVELAFKNVTISFDLNEDGSAVFHILSDNDFTKGRIAQTIVLKATEMGLSNCCINDNDVLLFR